MENENKKTIKSIPHTEKTLAEQVADRIREYIIEQQLQIGDKIPNEFELIEQLHVGRGTIREAVKLLVSRNVLDVQRGRGTFVAQNTGIVEDPFGFSYMEDEKRLMKELFQIRLQLEPWIAGLAAQQASDEDIEKIEQCKSETESLMRAGKNYLPADQKFHICIAASTENRVLPMLVPVITYSVHIMGKLLEVKQLEETAKTHQAIVDAIRAHDREAAEQAMRAHLMLNIRSVPKLEL